MRVSITIDGVKAHGGFAYLFADVSNFGDVVKKYIPATAAKRAHTVVKKMATIFNPESIKYVEVGYSRKRRKLQYLYVELSQAYVPKSMIDKAEKITNDVWWFYERGVFAFSFHFEKGKKRRR